MQWLGKAKDFVIDKANSVGIPIPKVEKTVDPEFDRARETFKVLKLDTENIIGYIVQMNTHLQILAKSTKRFGEDMGNMFVNTSQNTKNEAKSIEMFGGKLINFTDNILTKQMDSNVISPLAVYQKELKRLHDVKEKRKPAMREFDEARAKLQALKDSNQKYTDINAQAMETDKAFRKYNELNQDFITNVNRLQMQRAQCLDQPFRNLTSIMSQYLLQIFNEISRMKVSFPQHIFAPRVAMVPVGSVPQQPQMQQMPQNYQQMPQNTEEVNPYANLI